MTPHEHSDHSKWYDILWHFLNAEGRQAALFGEPCQKDARQAFLSCATGSAMPVVYLEVPLAGAPGFDLHVCIDRDSLAEGVCVPADAPAHAREFLEWLAGPHGIECTGVDFAFDLRRGNAASPQLITLLNHGSFEMAEEFFALVGAPDGATRYRRAERCAPEGWYSWYTGIIPARPGSPVRLDYAIRRNTRDAYQSDARLLEHDLAQLGYQLSSRQRTWCDELLTLPCGINLQLDALVTNTIGPVLGYNLIEGNLLPNATRQRLEGGWMQRALETCEAWGLADERWHHLRGLCQGKALTIRDDEGSARQVALSILPTFLKVRMTPDELVDAKAYVMCTFRELSRRVP